MLLFTKFLTLLSHSFLTLSQHSHFLLILSHKVIISLQFTHTFFLFPSTPREIKRDTQRSAAVRVGDAEMGVNVDINLQQVEEDSRAQITLKWMTTHAG